MGASTTAVSASSCSSQGSVALGRKWRASGLARNHSQVGAPTDGSPWLEKDCKFQSIRGNDYGEAPVFSRSANRNDLYPNERGDWIGFRVVRDL